MKPMPVLPPVHRFPRYRLFLGLLLPVLLMIGCSTASKVAKLPKKMISKFRTSGSDLSKSIAFTPFLDHTFVRDQGLAAAFEKQLINQFQKQCPKTRILTPDNPEFPRDLLKPPALASGAVDDFALARIGRRQGLNTVVAGGLLNISGDWKEKGILWFKNSKPQIKISLLVSVYDTETGSKIVDESKVHEFLVDENDLEAIRAKNESGVLLMADALQKVANDLAEKICERLNEQPWKCYVVSTVEDKIVLSAGSRSGLKPGRVLAVYARGEILEGVNGLKYIQRGEKLADFKVTTVNDDTAEASLVSGEVVRAGDTAVPVN